MDRIISKELIIIGSGPAGLKAAQEASEKGIDYVVLERGEIAQAWREIRPGMVMLSPCHPQRDWTSLSYKFPIWKLPVRRPYCTAKEFVNYLDEFADHFKLDVKTGHLVKEVTREESGFEVTCANGLSYRAPLLLIATGILSNPYIPDLPGTDQNPFVMHSHKYQGKEPFTQKKVLIVGAGNSAAETAIDLCGYAMVYLVSRADLKFFSDTKKLYHIRGVSESYLKELISMELIRYRAYQEIQKIEENTVYFKDWKLTVDKIIFATGYRAHIPALKNMNIRMNKHGYPEVVQTGESIQYPNLFFAGPLSFQTTVSIVVHGFLHSISDTVQRIAEKLREQ